MKRILLFVFTNIAVMIVLSLVYHIVSSVIGPGELSAYGIDLGNLAVFSLVFGMGGSLISLLISKPMAKFSTGAKTVDGTENAQTAWLVSTVGELADKAGIKRPEVAIYPGEANAFATGAFKNSALVAVSTRIMEQMTRDELRAVIGHEISHVSNGDMVTLCLVQGILNALVLFASRVLGYIVDRALSDGKNRRGRGIGYYLTYYICQIVFGIVASIIVCAYSRKREYAADAGSAKLIGTPTSMIAALRRLGNLQPGVLPDSIKAMGISGKRKVSLFSTHPALEDRIQALQNWNPDAL